MRLFGTGSSIGRFPEMRQKAKRGDLREDRHSLLLLIGIR